jgi:tetratricopeptide (TPR) repeat protein
LREFTSDVAAFDAADGTDDRAAVDRYTGDLMEGCYDEWLTAERDEYRRRVTAALSRLVPRLEERGELDAALRYAERARTLDRLAEAPYRALMRLHDAHGDRARAVRVYHECVTMLEDQLGVPPSDETRTLYETLLPPGDTAPRTGGVTAYVGRQAQRRQLTELWRVARDAPQLVVVTGEPGIGKTRLVDEFRLWVARQGAQTATARSYAAEGALAYAPVAAWLRDLGTAPNCARSTRPTTCWRWRATSSRVAAAWRNATDAAAEHLQAAIDRYRPANRSAHLLGYSQDPQVLCLVRLAHVRFCQGATAEARRLRDRALTAAHDAGHPFTLATALLFAALLELDLGDLPSMRNRVESLIGLRDRVEAPPIRLSTDALTGYLEVLDGAPAAGLARIGAALADPARDTAPGLTAMLCRIRLAAARAAGDDAAAGRRRAGCWRTTSGSGTRRRPAPAEERWRNARRRSLSA